MAGRPKIQFADDATGERVWQLIEKIQEYRLVADRQDFEKELLELSSAYPKANITATFKSDSAGEIVLSLLEAEASRIDAEAKALRDDRQLEDRYARMGKAVVKGDNGKIIGVQG